MILPFEIIGRIDQWNRVCGWSSLIRSFSVISLEIGPEKLKYPIDHDTDFSEDQPVLKKFARKHHQNQMLVSRG
jgi:hypothetical protein